MDQFEIFQNCSSFFREESQDGLFGDHDYGFNPGSVSFPDDHFDIFEPGFSIPELENDYHPDPLSFLNRCNAINFQAIGSSYSSSSSAAIDSTESTSKNTSARATMQSSPRASPEMSSTLDSNEVIHCRNMAKRKWQDHINVFSAKEGRKVVPKRRKAFSPSQRQVVALNRLIGACIQCKLRKGECDPGIPCKHCRSRAGGVMLGREICTRQSLVATRFDHIDLFQATFYEEALNKSGLKVVSGLWRTVYLGFTPQREQDNDEAYIEVPVVDLTSPNESYESENVIYNYFSSRITREKCHRSTLVWDSVPPVDRLIRSYRVSVHANKLDYASPFWLLQKEVQAFAIEYCSIEREMPLRDLLCKLLRMQELFSIYRSNLRITESMSCPVALLISNTSSIQLKSIIAKEIVQLELVILSEFDRLLYGPDKVGREKPIALWVCLWTLIFSYKGFAISAKAIIRNSEDDKLYELSRHLYNSLTSIYATLYNTTSPLTFDWRKSEVAQLLGNNQELIRLFCNIKTEMFWFEAEKESLFAEDALFKKLVLENENKLLEAHRKLAKKQGIL